MKKHACIFTKVLFALALMLCTALFAVPSQEAQAAKMTNKKAQKLLNKKIKNKVCRYTYVDLDNDKINEMIVYSFSGKFVKDDDSKKTITVYKVVGKKVKSIFEYSIDGDLFRPTLNFNVYRDPQGDSYLRIKHEHEGYDYDFTYYWNGTDFIEVGRAEWSLDDGYEYRVRLKVSTEEVYNDFMSDIFSNEVSLDVKTCSSKILKKYLKNKLKAKYNHVSSYLDQDLSSAKSVYKDLDGDGIDELWVKYGNLGGVVVYYYETDFGYDFNIDYNTYTIEDGAPVFSFGREFDLD
jgi:disulfide oxidoreductase YuzD